MTRYGLILEIILVFLLPTLHSYQLSIEKNYKDLTDLNESKRPISQSMNEKNNPSKGFNSIFGKFSDWVKNFFNPILSSGPIFHAPTFNFPRIFPFSSTQSGAHIYTEQHSNFEGFSIMELNRNKICNESISLDEDSNENDADREEDEQDDFITFECNGVTVDPKEFCNYPINNSNSHTENNKDGDGFIKVYSDEKHNITVWISTMSIQLKCSQHNTNNNKPAFFKNVTKKVAAKDENSTSLKTNFDKKSPQNLIDLTMSLLKEKFPKVEHHSRISLRHLNESLLNKSEIKLNFDMSQFKPTKNISRNDENVSKIHETILSQSFDMSQKLTANENWMKKQVATGVGILTIGMILGFFLTILIIVVIRKRHLKNSKSKKYTPSKQAKKREKKSAYKLDNDKAWEKFSAMLADTSDEEN